MRRCDADWLQQDVLFQITNIDMLIPKSTRRIEFRCLDETDVASLVALHQNSRVVSLIADGLINSPEMAARYVMAMGNIYRQRPGLGVWSSVERGARIPLGLFGLMPIDGGTDIEIGARLLESGWGRDYAVEGCESLVAHAFAVVGLKLLWATCLPEHRSAQYVLARLGFDFNGYRFAYGRRLVAFSKFSIQHELGSTLKPRREAMAQLQQWQETFSKT